MNKEQTIRAIASFIKNGLNMDNYSVYDCNLFMKKLFDYINSDTHFSADYSGNRITIESVFFDPLVSVELEKTTVLCIPINDVGWIDPVFEVLKFIHLHEQSRNEKIKKLKAKEKEDNKQFDWL